VRCRADTKDRQGGVWKLMIASRSSMYWVPRWRARRRVKANNKLQIKIRKYTRVSCWSDGMARVYTFAGRVRPPPSPPNRAIWLLRMHYKNKRGN
jgi:hypothetical protein